MKPEKDVGEVNSNSHLLINEYFFQLSRFFDIDSAIFEYLCKRD